MVRGRRCILCYYIGVVGPCISRSTILIWMFCSKVVMRVPTKEAGPKVGKTQFFREELGENDYFLDNAFLCLR